MTSTKRPGRGWAYTGALLGGAVSVAANVAHSYVPPAGEASGWTPHVGAVVGAVFWPVALFVAVEIFARTPWARQAKWVMLRWLGLLPVALVAAVVSYRHLSGLLAFYREDALTATIGPLAVDGLMVMATGALIATAAARGTVAEAAAEITETASTAERPPAVTPATVTSDDTRDDVTATLVKAAKTPRLRVNRRPASADKVARVAARMPDASIAQIAAKAGVSESTARRHLPVIERDPVDATVTSPTPLRPAKTPTPIDDVPVPVAA